MFWTNERLLELISQSLVGGDDSPLPLSPSSTIVIEYTQDSAEQKDLDVRIYVNDQLQKSKFCAFEDKCSASAFATSLDASIDAQDVTKVCQEGK